jgi:hypothetical protein
MPAWTGEELALEPVDELSVLTICDNVMDMPLPDQGPARRISTMGGRRVPTLDAPVLQGGKAPRPRPTRARRARGQGDGRTK